MNIARAHILRIKTDVSNTVKHVIYALRMLKYPCIITLSLMFRWRACGPCMAPWLQLTMEDHDLHWLMKIAESLIGYVWICINLLELKVQAFSKSVSWHDLPDWSEMVTLSFEIRPQSSRITSYITHFGLCQLSTPSLSMLGLYLYLRTPFFLLRVRKIFTHPIQNYYIITATKTTWKGSASTTSTSSELASRNSS